MPDEGYWQSFFDAESAIKKLFGNTVVDGDVVEFGCGYGTFTLPAARHSTGTLLALDIENDLIDSLRQRARQVSAFNIRAEVRDFITHGTGLSTGTQSQAMIYNLLHLEEPVALLKEAHRVLRIGGVLSVIHWRSDVPTPRGPSLEIRPKPEQCKAWINAAGFHDIHDVDLQESCPFHFGIVAVR